MLHFVCNLRTVSWISRKGTTLNQDSKMRILGIDPGTATVGYGVIDISGKGGESIEYVASGIIQTSKNSPPGARLSIIRTDLISIINEYTPDVVSVEAIFFFKNAKTLVPVAQARGVIMEAASCMGLPTAEYTPMQVKLHLTGHGRADKRVVQEMIARLLNLSDIVRPDDASDALAIAVCHARLSLNGTLCLTG
jgi:crossover junction endodeoxyribonuclease RuvC